MVADGSRFPPDGVKFVRVGGREIREHQRGRRYYVRFQCYFAGDGGVVFRRNSPWRKVEGRKRDAEAEAVRYRMELETMLGVRRTSMTVATFADDYQRSREAEAERADSRLSPLTVERDALEIRRVKRYFGDVE